MVEDVIVIGGGFAGLSAALYLARSNRKVLVLDSGEPRNRFASHSHGVLALDGIAPMEMLRIARAQLLSYPNARFLSKKVSAVHKKSSDDRPFFAVETEDKESYSSRRLILAMGIVDQLPDIPGLKERWGKSVFHCPYCDAYELGGGPIGVLAVSLPSSSSAVEYAKLLTDWGEIIFFPNGCFELDQPARDDLTKRKVKINEHDIVSLEGSTSSYSGDGKLDRTVVVLDDGSRVELRAVFIETHFRVATSFAQDLGCDFKETARGLILKTDDWKQTSVPGVFAAGDLARSGQSIPYASADGALAAVGCHQSLLGEEH